jgi:3-oxoadipate enol-lactonase
MGPVLDVETIGQGPDLVLLHSLLTDRSSFEGLAGQLKNQRRVHLVSLPGYGKSAPAESLEDSADRIAEFCCGLNSKPDMIGNGLGSFVALTLAARHGQQIGRLVLLGGAIAFSEQGRATFRGLADKVEREGMAPVAEIAMTRMLSEDFIAANPEIAADRKRTFLRIDPVVFAAAARALATLDLSNQLASIRNPVLILTGEKDAATPPELGRQLAERLPAGRFVGLPDIGHAPHIQALAQTIAIIAPFLGVAALETNPNQASLADVRLS